MSEHENHGHSVAAWTGVVVITLGTLLLSIAAVVTSTPMAIIGAIVVVLGVVAGKVLSKAGYGVKAPN